MSSDHKSSSSPHPPRLCNIVRTPTFSGYGFNLHTIKNKTGQYIGQVDEGSPAEKALLKHGDRIVEVNGVNIASENHKQVVSRIKLVANETNLLVVDDDADKWYKEHNIVISSELPEVVRGSSVARRPSTSSSEGKPARSEDRRSVASVSSATNSEASNRQDNQEGAAAAAVVVDSDADSVAEVSAIKNEANGDAKSVSSSSDDDKEVDDDKPVAPVTEKVVAAAVTNGNHEEPADKREISEKSAESSDSDESDDEAKTSINNLKKPTIKTVVEEDQESESEKSRSVSVSSASSRGSAGNSQGTNPVVDKSPVSTSPSPPSSVGAPSPTPTPAYNFKNTGGLNLNMTAAEMREMISSKKKKDIRHTEIDLRKKYEIVQKL